MTQKTIIILGSGHLADKLTNALHHEGYAVSRAKSHLFREVEDTDIEESSFEYAKKVLREKGIEGVGTVCILDEEDKRNIHLMIAVLGISEKIPMIVSLTNENLVEHLAKMHKNVQIINPTELATPVFINALKSTEGDHGQKYLTKKTINSLLGDKADRLVYKLFGGFIIVLFLGAVFFHVTDNVSWVDSFYLIATVVTSVNFNDVNLHNYAPEFKIIRTLMILFVQFFILFVFSLVIDHLITRRTEALFYGKKKHKMKDHVIVCGIGRVGHHIVEELLERNIKILVVEADEHNRYLDGLRMRNVPLLIGAANISKNLYDAGVIDAKAIISVVNNDLVNLEIGLDARALNPKIKVVLRIYDDGAAQEIRKHLGIKDVLSTSAIAAEKIVAKVKKEIN